MRMYSVNFENVAVAAAQDLIAVYTGSAMAIEVHSVSIGQVTSTTVGNLRVSLRRLPATVTTGSGGGAGTINRMTPGDAAATVTSRINDTTPATTSGTAVTLVADAFNVINGWLWMPPPEDRPIITLSQAFVFSLLAAPGSSQNMSASIIFRELL